MTDVAHRVLVCGGIPVECLPFCGIELRLRCGDEYGNVLCIQRMGMRATVCAPKMVVVDLRSWQVADGGLCGDTWPEIVPSSTLTVGICLFGENSAGSPEQSCRATMKVEQTEAGVLAQVRRSCRRCQSRDRSVTLCRALEPLTKAVQSSARTTRTRAELLRVLIIVNRPLGEREALRRIIQRI